MAEEFSEIERSSIQKQCVADRLKEYPGLTAKVEAMLDIMENAGGDLVKAAEAEQRIIEELRQTGNEVLQGWAQRQNEKKENEYTVKAGVNRKKRKASTGTRGLGKSK